MPLQKQERSGLHGFSVEPRRSRGITLIELMTVIAVVAVLGSIAVSTYRNYLLRTNRTEAKMALLRVQAAQEKYFLQQNEYGTLAQLGVPNVTPSGYYNIAVALDEDNLEYTATATAAAGQTEDEGCPTFTINHEGERTPVDATGCWR